MSSPSSVPRPLFPISHRSHMSLWLVIRNVVFIPILGCQGPSTPTLWPPNHKHSPCTHSWFFRVNQRQFSLLFQFQSFIKSLISSIHTILYLVIWLIIFSYSLALLSTFSPPYRPLRGTFKEPKLLFFLTLWPNLPPLLFLERPFTFTRGTEPHCHARFPSQATTIHVSLVMECIDSMWFKFNVIETNLFVF